MVDRVKPLKIETDSQGTQIDPFPTEMNSDQDYVAAKGLSFECLDTVLLDKTAENEINILDSLIPNKTMSDIRFSVETVTYDVFIKPNLQMVIHDQILLDSGCLIVEGQVIMEI